MSICKSVFQKEVYDVELTDLEAFFSTDQEETSVLEFKEGSTTLEKIHKEVAAFLNTEGGLLIIGAPKEKPHSSKKHLKVCSGVLTPCMIRDQDTLLRSIASNISPAPMGIKAKTLHIQGGSVYILEIRQSYTPPHQVSAEGIYYIRLERDSKPAPHGIVQALFQKRQRPALQLDIEADIIDGDDPDSPLLLKIITTNSAVVTAENIGYLISFYGVTTAKDMGTDNSLMTNPVSEEAELKIYTPNAILVKGLDMRVEVAVRLAAPCVLVHSGVYARDTPVENYFHLIGKDGSIISYYKGNESDPEDVKGEIFRAYAKRRAEAFAEQMNGVQNLGLVEAQDISDLETTLKRVGVLLPQSYVDFLSGMNGFVGALRSNIHVTFYSSKRLLEIRNIQFNEHGGYIIEIGLIDTYQLFIRYEKDLITFELLVQPSLGGAPFFITLARSFINLLAIIKSSNSIEHLKRRGITRAA